MGKITEAEARARAQTAEHAFTQRLRGIDAEMEQKKNAHAAGASREVANVDKWYKAELSELQAERQRKESKEGAAHKKRLAQAKQTHQSELKKISNHHEGQRLAVRQDKAARMGPIEEALLHQVEGVDEWRVEQMAIAEQERLEALSQIGEIEEAPEPETEPQEEPESK